MLNKFQSAITLGQTKVSPLVIGNSLAGFFKRFFPLPLKHPFVTLIFLALIIVVFGVLRMPFLKSFQEKNKSDATLAAAAQSSLNKQLVVSIKDQSGKETGQNLTINLTTLERSDRILINGKPASAREGKDFLIINLTIDNPTKDQLNVRPLDLVRYVDSQGKSFAPDIHNDTIKAEPLSVRKSRVGFVVDENEKDFKFLVGEINGNRETIEVQI